ncbi:MAG: transcriptional regulator BetI [Dongiaceae bacterium]
MSKLNFIKEARQRQLIDATISTIGKVGYAGTTLNHVAGAAGLSPGIVNFYFKSKDQLLAATLAQLAEEHESFWMAQVAASGGAAEAGLDAMVEADFHPTICTLDKVVVWFAFWSEAQSRPLYRSVVSELEERYHVKALEFCERLMAEGGYSGVDPAAVAHGINALIDGLWADLIIAPENFDREAAKHICRTFLRAIFPRHFQGGAGPTPAIEPMAPIRSEGPVLVEPPAPAAIAHRARFAAALQRRLAPETTLHLPELAGQIGIELEEVYAWLQGATEPSSYVLGQLASRFDPAFLIEIYGPEIEQTERRLDQRVADQRQDEKRQRAALMLLKGRDT